MSDKLAAWAQARQGVQPAKPKREDGPRWNAQERAALRKLRREAKAVGATLETGGEGGLSPSLVLGVMRRDGYTCKACGKNVDLSLHHKSEHMLDPKAKRRSAFLRERGRVDSPANLVTICKSCHDGVHERDREENADERRAEDV